MPSKKPLTNRDVQRQIGLTGRFIDFVRIAWPVVEPNKPFIDGWHIQALCDHLEAAHRRELRRLVINIPPGCMKSMSVSVLFQVWSWIRDATSKWMVASFDGSLTLRDARRALALIRSDWFRDRWGDLVFVGPQVAESNFENHKKGLRFSTSIDGKNTGRHYDFKIVDDPLKPRDLTKVALDGVIEGFYKNTLVSRVMPGTTPTDVTICIMQRLHDNDLAGYLLREEGFTGLVLPMRFETKTRCVTPIFEDPRQVEGELLWPNGKSEEAVKELEKSMGPRVAAAQLQQRPVPDGGQVFKREWFRYYKKMGLPSKWAQQIQTWDCSFKDSDSADYVVGQVWGRADGNYYLLDQIRERLNAPATCEAIKTMRRKWPRATAILIEDKANGPAVISMLRKTVSGIIEVNPKGGKESRANAVAPLFEAGNVYIPDPTDFGTWVDDYVNELCSFPFASYDDQVDATSQGLCYLFEKSSRLVAAMSRLKGPSDMLRLFG